MILSTKREEEGEGALEDWFKSKRKFPLSVSSSIPSKDVSSLISAERVSSSISDEAVSSSPNYISSLFSTKRDSPSIPSSNRDSMNSVSVTGEGHLLFTCNALDVAAP